jgi:hypothetical protein
MAEYLHHAGHDVRVLTAERAHPDRSLPATVSRDLIVRTNWLDTNRLILPWRKRAKERGDAVRTTPDVQRSSPLAELFINLVRIPDQQNGWLPYAIPAAKRLLKHYPADVIYASGPPFSTFFIARTLSRKFSIPWVAEYRDGWSRYVYAPKPEWRQSIDAYLERRVSRTAAAIVAVSGPWAEHYRERFQSPTVAIYNGFDPDGLPHRSQRMPAPAEPLSIVYMGALYGGLRDPSVLYEAIKRSGLTPKQLKICYYGPTAAEIYPLAEKLDVLDFVVLKDRVPYRTSLETQRASDVLLLLQSPEDPRNVPAKIFEYLALCRPILGLGLDGGIPAQLVRERGAGIYITDADAVAAQLRRWVAEKENTGVIPDLPSSVHAGLTQSTQFKQLSDFLRTVVQEARSTLRSGRQRAPNSLNRPEQDSSPLDLHR